jgi:hypothetical protein
MTQFSFEWILSLNSLCQKWGQVHTTFQYVPIILLLASAESLGHISLPPSRLGCILLPMSFRPVRKIAGIGNVFLGTELVDIAEYDLEIYEENPEDHEHHGANWTPGAKKIEGTVVGELPIRKDLRLLTEEGYSVKFYLRDSFGSVVILDPMLDSNGNPVR